MQHSEPCVAGCLIQLQDANPIHSYPLIPVAKLSLQTTPDKFFKLLIHRLHETPELVRAV